MGLLFGDPGECIVCGAAHTTCRGTTPDSEQVARLKSRVQVSINRRRLPDVVGGQIMPQDKGPTTYREGQPPEVAPPANRNVPARQAEPSTDTGEDEAPRRRSRPSSSRTGAKKKKAAQKPRRR